METLKEFGVWILKTKPVFEKIENFCIILERYQYETQADEKTLFLKNQSLEHEKTLMQLIEQLKIFKIDEIEGLQHEALKDRYWLILFSLFVCQSNIACMVQKDYNPSWVTECFDILVNKLQANLGIKEFDQVELNSSHEDVLDDENSAHLIYFVMQIYLQAGFCKYSSKNFDATINFFHEIDRLYNNR